MKILIIEDEQPAALQLRKLIEQIDSSHSVVGILASNSELIMWASTNPWPDLIFSDIELLDGPVFNSLRKLNPDAPIIFTTAYNNYMAEAFDANGISYLLKPFSEKQLSDAIQKFHRLTGSQPSLMEALSQLGNLIEDSPFKSRFTIRKGAGMYLLLVDTIACMRMENGVLHAYDTTGKSHLLSMSLTDCLDQLNPNKFFLINRGECVSWQHIDRLESYGKDRLAIYVIGQSSPLISSVTKTPQLRKWLEG